MHLYHLTVQPPTLITHLLVGSFTGTPKQQEILLVRGDRFLELIRVNSARNLEQIKSVNNINTDSSKNNNFSTTAIQPFFGTIRSIGLLKIPGDSHRDYVVIGSDSGATVILELKSDQNNGVWYWERVSGMTHGRSGSRRSIPGQMIAVDPRGRALITAAQDSRKFAHSIGRSEDKINLSSPLESHHPGHLCAALVALDSGLDHHPAFATLEIDYGELDSNQLENLKAPIQLENIQKNLCYYEFDQGLNNVVRKWNEPVSFAAQALVPVPGGSDGPGGVLIFTPGYISYHRPSKPAKNLQLPKSMTNSLLIASALIKTKSVFFFLVQFEGGDLFKLTISTDEQTGSYSLSLKYFDTVPEAVALTVLRSGFLFLAAQNGPSHILYQITGLGDDPDQPEYTNENVLIEEYQRHSELVNLSECDTLPHFGPVTDGRIMNIGNEDSPQLYMTHKESLNNSSVSIARWGTALQESVNLELPEGTEITGIWSSRSNHLLLSTPDSTILLSVNLEESSVEQVEFSDSFASSLKLDTLTITAGHLDRPMSDSSVSSTSMAPFIQVHPTGLQLIHSSLREWSPGPGKFIKSADFNGRQIVLALDSCELVRLAFDPNTESLSEESSSEESFPTAIDHVSIAPLLKGRKSARWIAIATKEDSTIRIIDAETSATSQSLEIAAIQALTTEPTSLVFSRETSSSGESILVLHVGLLGGILIRFRVDEQNGSLIEPTSRFIGSDCVKITTPFEDGSLLALGTRPWWMSRDHLNRPVISPLFYSNLTAACPFNSFGTFAAISSEIDENNESSSVSLKVLTVQPGNAASPFYQHPLQLPSGGLPRKITFEPSAGLFSIAQMDRVTLFDPFKGVIGTAIEYHGNEVALNCCFVRFHDKMSQTFLAVAGARDFIVTPRSASESFIDLFPIDVTTAQLGPRLHRTPLDCPASAMSAFNGRLLVGVGYDLRMLECGRSRLLRKTQCRLASPVVSIKSQGLRIFVGTARDSHVLLVYRPDSNGLVQIADNPLPSGIVTNCLLDYDTIAASDRFGNVFIDRLPDAISESLEQDRFLAGSGVGADAREYLLAAPEKFEKLIQFYVGDTITILERIAWAGETGREAIWYVTISGAIGCFLPLPTKSSAVTASAIETALRNSSYQTDPLHPAIANRVDLLMRSHAAYRSTFSPVKAVIDGDFIEQLLSLPESTQHSLAQSIDRPLNEIKLKIEEWRRLIGI